ncbi:Aste57867_316 [Aphanomyces stellatus]|uniref:Aste57867_316 protein n=1 Tax=Aphanomyces stellatus TaxID=120398 RepID=A0A485K6G2_9STRA|nr:hypothetical protein As57867_000316 [Aphanomyces stellatus]VFT77542.1 Aste57867_316 [Aphanomyces stellatus]
MEKTKTNNKDAVAVLLPDAAHVVLSDLRVDFQVQEQGSLFRPGQKWVWRQFVIHGQELTILNAATAKSLVVLQTPHCSLHPQAGNQVLLHVNGKTQMTLFCPSATRLRKFQAVLRLSASTPYWVLPPQDIFQDLIDVATTIVETDLATSTLSSKAPPSVTPADVTTYLDTIKPVYDHLLTLPTQTDFLDYLVQLETDYLTDRATVSTFASMVHRLHPIDYAHAQSDSWTLASDTCSVCPHPHCNMPFSTDIAFDLRVLGKSYQCRVCHNVITSHTFRLAAFLRAYSTFPVTIGSVSHIIFMPLLPKDGSPDSYQRNVARAIYWFQQQTRVVLPRSEHERLETTLALYVQRLDLVAAMARHLGYVTPLCSNFDYWRHPTVMAASIVRYHQYLHVVQIQSKNSRWALPTVDIALVHHVHQILSSIPLAGFTLHSHEMDMDIAYTETFLVWAEQFNDAYSSAPPSLDAYMAAKRNLVTKSQRMKRWDTWRRLPSRDCRYVGVYEYVDTLPCATAISDSTRGAVASDDIVLVHDDDSPTLDVVAVIGTPVMDGGRLRHPPTNAKPARGLHPLRHGGSVVLEVLAAAVLTALV